MFILDFQCFQYQESDFYIREMSLLQIYSGEIHHFMIKTHHPEDWFCLKIQKHMEWLTKNCHGLDWNSQRPEDLPSENVADCIKSIVGDSVLCVKGISKVNLLNKIVPNKIINLESLGCPSFHQLKCIRNVNFHCGLHFINNLNCSKEHVCLLYEWFKNKKTF